MTTEDPLVPRPAATVMLIRDTADGHQGVPDAAALRDGLRRRRDGVSRRWRRRPRPQRRRRVVRPRAAAGGPSGSASTPDLAEALVCAAARETFEESGVLFAGPADDPDGIVGDASIYRRSAAGAGGPLAVVRGSSCAARTWCCVRILLRPWANWVTPKEERTRRYDTYFFVGALPEGQRADGDNTETDRADLDHARRQRSTDFAEARTFLLPPTWTQLDSLAGRTRRRSACRGTSDRRRRTASCRRQATATGRSSSSTATATTTPATTARPDGYGADTRRLHERVRLRPHQR